MKKGKLFHYLQCVAFILTHLCFSNYIHILSISFLWRVRLWIQVFENNFFSGFNNAYVWFSVQRYLQILCAEILKILESLQITGLVSVQWAFYAITTFCLNCLCQIIATSFFSNGVSSPALISEMSSASLPLCPMGNICFY